MGKIKYVEKKFKPATLERISQVNEILAEYQANGFDMTIRQLYYQLVARGIIENTDKSYSRLVNLVNNGRMAGLINWKTLEDRTRQLHGTIHEHSPRSAIRSLAETYVIDKWDNQDWRIEVWVEKEALLDVFARICNELDLDYFTSRGFNSQSAMWRAAMRMRVYQARGQRPMVLHFADHDPSGIDMTRDLGERFKVFGADVVVKRIALTMDQVGEYRPPPNPAKMTDPRAKSYISRYGEQSWELDALTPQVLHQLVQDEVFAYRDVDAWEVAVEREAEERRLMQEVAGNWDQITENL